MRICIWNFIKRKVAGFRDVISTTISDHSHIPIRSVNMAPYAVVLSYSDPSRPLAIIHIIPRCRDRDTRADCDYDCCDNADYARKNSWQNIRLRGGRVLVSDSLLSRVRCAMFYSNSALGSRI